MDLHALASGATPSQSTNTLTRAYSIQAVQHAANRAVALVRGFLLEEAPGSQVHDVQEDPRFCHRGVDLLWERAGLEVLGVEVKGDRQAARRGTPLVQVAKFSNRGGPFKAGDDDFRALGRVEGDETGGREGRRGYCWG